MSRFTITVTVETDGTLENATRVKTDIEDESAPAASPGSALRTLSFSLPNAVDPELEAQLELIQSSYIGSIREGAAKFSLPVPIIAGIGSRESGWGRGLTPPGPTGTGDFTPREGEPLPPDGKGYGRGLMQIDYDAHEFARTGPWEDARENILYACQVLAESRDYIARNTRLSGSSLLRAAVAGYNAGEGTVANDVNAGRDPDAHTAHHNYSQDVLQRATWFSSRLK